MKRRVAMIVLALSLGACDSGTSGDAGADNAAIPNQVVALPAETGNGQAAAQPALAACPFRETRDWHGSVEGGRLLVNGKVDLLMAGFKPTLTRRDSAAPGTIAFDLALVPEPGAVVNDRARYEATGAQRYARAEIYCGGKRIAEVQMVHVAD